MNNVSVLIRTLNEELDIGDCIRSVLWSDDVHVLDSGSTDRTVQIARSLGAKVRQRKFDDYASQGNSGLHETHFEHQWVLLLDADERVPPQLKKELQIMADSPPGKASAYRIRRRDYFMGKWLKHVQASPFYVRLVRPERVHFERPVNEILRVQGETHDTTAWIDHFPFSKGIERWFERHNRYSSMEAKIIYMSRTSGLADATIRNLFTRDFHIRREAQKSLFYRLPFRPTVKFLILYCLKGGFLDGRAGLTYAVLQSIYEFQITVKTGELIRSQQSPSTGQDCPPRSGEDPLAM